MVWKTTRYVSKIFLNLTFIKMSDKTSAVTNDTRLIIVLKIFINKGIAAISDTHSDIASKQSEKYFIKNISIKLCWLHYLLPTKIIEYLSDTAKIFSEKYIFKNLFLKCTRVQWKAIWMFQLSQHIFKNTFMKQYFPYWI